MGGGGQARGKVGKRRREEGKDLQPDGCGQKGLEHTMRVGGWGRGRYQGVSCTREAGPRNHAPRAHALAILIAARVARLASKGGDTLVLIGQTNLR